MKVRLYIPSTGRSNRQVTLKSLPPSWLRKTALVVADKEYEAYSSKHHVPVMPHTDLKGIGLIRHGVMSSTDADYVLMLDDDMVFYVRRKDKLVNATPREVGEGLDMLVRWLDEEPNVGETSMSISMVNFRKPKDFYYNEKCGPVMCIRKSAYDKLKYKFDAFPRLHEDNAVTLGLLTSGYKVKVAYNYSFKNLPPLPEHRKTGCSGYRTPEMEMEACLELQKLFDPYVQIHEVKDPKESKYTLYNRPARPIIRWKRAYDESNKL